MTRASAAKILTPIWLRVLRRSSVGEHENFFDLGGTPSSAARLFADIAQAFGRDIPPLMIYCAPTIKTLAELLEDLIPRSLPPLLLLKSGTEHPPVFIAHGIGGTVLGLSDLVGKIKFGHPIYGMQARGIDGVSEPLTSIEERAEFHLDAIRQIQVRGPYLLIGYSLGGFVALEIAQRLVVAGEKVALLALLDSYPEKNNLSLAQHMLLSFRRTKRHAKAMIESALTRARSQANENSDGNEFQREPSNVSTDTVTQRMRDADYVAWRRYHPQYYPGRIKFVKAGISTCFPDNPTAVWAHLAEEFEVETTPGDHVGMVTTHCEDLGSVLSACLRESAERGADVHLKLTA